MITRGNVHGSKYSNGGWMSASTLEPREDSRVHRSGEEIGNVLIVDDDPLVQMGLAMALERMGYEVTRASEGEGGLEAAARLQPDLILLDVSMPGIDGFETCRRLKANPGTHMIPVVFLSGNGGRESRIEGLAAGAADFISKPCDLGELELRVRNQVRMQRLINDLDSAETILFSIARAVEARDGSTGDHCERIAHLVVRLGRSLGLKNGQIVALRRAGYLHDIGKISVPDAVLLKPGRLTEDEQKTMRQHPVDGVQICEPLRTMRPVLPIIRHHHEKFDGSGYPDGLKGDEIPYLARVFQVVDIFDALTNNRVYRKALSAGEAMEILEQESRKGWWDPVVVGAFRSMLGREGVPGEGHAGVRSCRPEQETALPSEDRPRPLQDH